MYLNTKLFREQIKNAKKTLENNVGGGGGKVPMNKSDVRLIVLTDYTQVDSCTSHEAQKGITMRYKLSYLLNMSQCDQNRIFANI